MPSIDDVTAAIGGTAEDTANAAVKGGAAHTATTELARQLDAMGADGTAHTVHAAAGQVDEANAMLSQAEAKLRDAHATAESARGRLTAATGGGAAAPAPAARPFKAMRTDPEKAAEIRPHAGKHYAVASLYDADGNRVLGPHSASDDGPAATATWRQPWGSYPRLRRHVEAHAAARMHRDGHRTAVMYINMKPCGYDPGGCEKNLPAILPAGAVLWVHQVGERGGTVVTRYEGTGDASKERQ